MNGNTRIAVVGLGGIAQLVHLPILAKLKDVTIAAVAEINKNRLDTVAGKYNIKQKYSDYTKLLVEADFDAAIIATPTNTHYQIAADFLKAKKNLLIEKPMTPTLKEARKIDELAKQNKCKVMTGMNLRFRPDAMLLKSLLNSSELGELFYIRCGWLRKQSSAEKWFLKKSEAGGGVITDLGINLFDLALWLLDFPEVVSVSAQSFHHKTKTVEDSAVGFIRCKNSAVINFDVSWSLHSESDGFNLTTYCSEGTAHLNPLRVYRRLDSGQIDLAPQTSKKNLFKKAYENELKHFISAVRENNPVISSSTDAVKSIALIESIYKSIEKNKEVTLR